MNALTIASQIIEAQNAPIEVVTGPRKAKVTAANRIRIPSEAAAAAKGRKKRMAAEKREARAQAKLDREAKKTQKADKVNKRKTKKVNKVKGPSKRALAKQVAARRKSIREAKEAHSTFKKELKTTRRNLMTGWKEKARAEKEMSRCVALIFKSDEKRKKKAAKAAKKLAKEEAAAAKKAAKVATPKRVKLTDEQKLANKAQRAYDCEMRRRAKWLKDYTAKYDLDSRANPIEEPEFLDDGLVC